MVNRDVSRRITRLDDLFKRVREAADLNAEMQAHWARYLCVLASGLIEKAVAELLVAYSKHRSNAQVASFVDYYASRLQNAKTEKILDLLRAFDASWPDAFLARLDDGDKEAIDSIVANRHQIAHGANTGMSFTTMSDYWLRAKRFLETLETHLA